MIKLNLGCGPVQPLDWINVDGSNRAWLASRYNWFDNLLVKAKVISVTEFKSSTVYANLNRRLPWSENKVDSVYLGEVLEHFTKADGAALIAECFRVLKSGGVIRCRVPDNYRFWKNYINDYEATVSKSPEHWTLEHSKWVEMFFRDICVKHKRFASYGHFHKWMYDEVSLSLLFKTVGFTQIERKKYLDSRIDNVKAVETHEDLTIEAIKP